MILSLLTNLVQKVLHQKRETAALVYRARRPFLGRHGCGISRQLAAAFDLGQKSIASSNGEAQRFFPYPSELMHKWDGDGGVIARIQGSRIADFVYIDWPNSIDTARHWMNVDGGVVVGKLTAFGLQRL